MSPEAINHLETYSFSLIQQISEQTREAIRQTILRAFKEGGHPYEQARSIRNVIGLTARQEQAVANYEASLSGNSATRDALTRALRDGRFDSTVARSITNQTPLSQAQVDKMVDRYRSRFIDYRAKTIARTESVRASNLGQREVWRQAKQQGLIEEDQKRVWITSGDDKTCDDCAGLDGTEVGLDEEFEDGVMDPPDPHPDCRCTTALSIKKRDSLRVA
jgi:SPP1 gp7 family putative phage head morphogenesis protein